MPFDDERPRKVLVAYDGSLAAATAFPLAHALADQLHAIVEVLYVAPPEGVDAALWRRLHIDLRPTDEVQIRSNVSDPVAAILQATHDPGVEIVVLTTHGRIIEPGRAMGRVAEKVVSATRQPVLLVRPEAPRAPDQQVPPLGRLLLPLDGTSATATAVRPATELASRLGADLDLLYVVSPRQSSKVRERGSIGVPRYIDQPHHEWPAWAARMIDHLGAHIGGQPQDVTMTVFLTVGDVSSEINRFAAEHWSDAIVLARRSHFEIGRASVLRAVLNDAPCPVMLVAAG